jgi:quercetin dioxygenase-like cupin family protein
MKRYRLEDFSKGWVVGNFLPSLFVNSNFEIAVKFFKAGDSEAEHKQIVATEITIVVEGSISMGGKNYERGDIVVIEPNEVCGFTSITDSSLVCVKFPSLPNDKVLVDE